MCAKTCAKVGVVRGEHTKSAIVEIRQSRFIIAYRKWSGKRGSNPRPSAWEVER